MWLWANGEEMIPFTMTNSSFVTRVCSPSPKMVPTEDNLSSPETVATQSLIVTCEAYLRGSGEDVPHEPAGSTWLLVILMSRPLAVVMWTKSAVSLLALWGIYTTSEKEILPAASAASTLSPTMIWEICRSSPDSSLTVSDPAKQSLTLSEIDGDAAAFLFAAIISYLKPPTLHTPSGAVSVPLGAVQSDFSNFWIVYDVARKEARRWWLHTRRHDDMELDSCVDEIRVNWCLKSSC